MKIKEIVLLEAIRKTKSAIPLPIRGEWAPIKEPVKALFKSGYLEIKDGLFVVSDEGKKTAMLFNDIRKDLIEPFKDYTEFTVNGVTIDGRLPMASFNIRGKLDEAIALDYLQNLNVFLIWDEFFKYIKGLQAEGANWQEVLFDTFTLQAEYNVTVDAWKRLGIDENSAIIAASKSLLPELTQITREYDV